MQILEPFRQQFLWNKPTDPNDPAYAKWGQPFSKYIDNIFITLQEDDPACSILTNQDIDPEIKVSLSGIDGKLFALFIIASYLVHIALRGIIGFFGALLESAERAVEFAPSKLLFYILKQPFKWGETAISATFNILDGLLILGSALTNTLSYLWRGNIALIESKTLFKSFIEKTPLAIIRLFITGVIGIAGYFLGVPGVLTLAGTLGTAGAGLAIAGIGAISTTAIQAATIKTIESCDSCCPTSTGLMYKKGITDLSKKHSDHTDTIAPSRSALKESKESSKQKQTKQKQTINIPASDSLRHQEKNLKYV